MGKLTSSPGSRRGVGAGVALALAATTALSAPPPVEAAAPPTDRPVSAHGITVLDWREVDLDILDPDNPPMYDARVATDAVYTPATAPEVRDLVVRIHLPEGYDPDRAQGYPVLYLLHGGGGKWSDWSEFNTGNLPDAIEASGYPGIVVMPDGGRSGWYRNWASDTRGGFRPLWEDFHVDQLVPWVDANFNTVPDRSGRAIAGLSMGGFGALSYAARNPGVFGAVGSFSGGTDIDALAVDPTHQDAREIVDSALVAFGASIVFQGVIGFDAMDYRLPGTTIDARLGEVFGPPSQWPAFNPQDLAEAGAYAPFDGAMAVYTGNEGTDFELGGWNTTFHQALAAGGVDHVFCKGPGQHDWEHWRGHVQHFMSILAGNPPASCPFV